MAETPNALDVNQQENTQLSVFDRISNPIEAVEKFGEFIAKSGFFGCEKIEQGKVLALACLCERKNPVQIAREYHIIDGKLAMRSDAMLAGYRQRGGRVKWEKCDAEAAIAEFSQDGTAIRLAFTLEDAKKAGLITGNPKSSWSKYPDAMLRARLISKAVRMLMPEVNCGIYTPEEISDFSSEAPTPPKQELKPVQGKVVEPKKVEAPAEPEKKPEPAKSETKPEAKPETMLEAKQAGLPKPWQMVQEVLAGKPEVMPWLIKNSWTNEKDGWTGLCDKDCERILARIDPFLRAVAANKQLESMRNK